MSGLIPIMAYFRDQWYCNVFEHPPQTVLLPVKRNGSWNEHQQESWKICNLAFPVCPASWDRKPFELVLQCFTLLRLYLKTQGQFSKISRFVLFFETSLDFGKKSWWVMITNSLFSFLAYSRSSFLKLWYATISIKYLNIETLGLMQRFQWSLCHLFV